MMVYCSQTFWRYTLVSSLSLFKKKINPSLGLLVREPYGGYGEIIDTSLSRYFQGVFTVFYIVQFSHMKLHLKTNSRERRKKEWMFLCLTIL